MLVETAQPRAARDVGSQVMTVSGAGYAATRAWGYTEILFRTLVSKLEITKRNSNFCQVTSLELSGR